ncbi:PHD finger protein 24-like isoform X1 [Anguilla rostrata]|uniref:PHD finger protein 24-like isoform X1 n=1 Tax=Anguilla rostrata TaxID=7938 RepID=UPI0030CFA60F
MGVLMSRKQQVEKVQKCNTVISAFKEGLRDRPAPPSHADEPAGGVARGADSAPWPRRTTEENEPKEEGGNPKPSSAQQPSAPPKEEARANQESWSRLRDGKGVEPEEMDRMNQLTPPAFVRPKKDAKDEQPLEVDLSQREQPADEEMCEVCEVWTADDLFPCRTCRRVFHDGCLREMGYLSTAALQEMRESAHTATGWSCYYCDNVNLLLTEEEMYSLLDTFKRCKIIPESCLGSDDFLHYKQLLEKDLSDEQEEEVMAQFSALDPEKRGSVGWTDFLYHESLGVLRKFRTANSLVRLLTAKERDRARAVFGGLDLDRDGLITWREVQRAQQSWFQKHAKESQSCNVRLTRLCSPVLNLSISHVGPISENSPTSSISGRSQEKAPITSEKEDNRSTDTIKKLHVSWQEFLKESAIYILAARPNSPALHLCPPL